MKFDWKYLIVAIIIFGALASKTGAWGKWIFGIVFLGILLAFGDKIIPIGK